MFLLVEMQHCATLSRVCKEIIEKAFLDNAQGNKELFLEIDTLLMMKITYVIRVIYGPRMRLIKNTL